jgi:acyl-CoA synthetase (AMP-forming)/AMP-acid ligase II
MSLNVGDLIRRDLDPAKTAIVDLGGEWAPREISFAALDATADGAARALLRRGLVRGDRIAILAANRAEYLAAAFGAERAGLVAVPVNFKFPRETIAFILADCGARFAFCDEERRAGLPLDLPSVTFGAEFQQFLDMGPFAAVTPAADEAALILYTSGSTGRPKGVVLSHAGQIWTVEARLGGQVLSHYRYLVAAPLYHMNALALAQLACAAHATIVLLPQFAARAYIEAIGAFRPTYLTGVPPMMAMMLQERELLARTDLSSVEWVRMGSAPVSASLVAALRAALPKAGIANAYGTTEAGPVVFGAHPEGLPAPEGSLGYPHQGVALRLVGADGCQADEGVLAMKSPALMLGYHNRPERRPLTADGYYLTSDVFRRDAQGFYFFIGRSDDMFVSGGENIYPTEVERMLERHADVAEACVVPLADEIKGQKPVAFIVPKPGRAPSEREIKEFALAHGPAYQHPRSVWFIDRMPLASTNKVDRGALRQTAERNAR